MSAQGRTVRKNAYDYAEANDLVIQDVFALVESQIPGWQHLEKAPGELRLKASLLLLDNDLAMKPDQIMRLAGKGEKGTIFKVADEESWRRFCSTVEELLTMNDELLARRMKKTLSKAERESLKQSLSTLKDTTLLPFSQDNLDYCFKRLGLDLCAERLVRSSEYYELVKVREVMDRLALLLKNEMETVSRRSEKAPRGLRAALMARDLPAFRKVLGRLTKDGNDLPPRYLKNNLLLRSTLDHEVVKDDLRFYICLYNQVQSSRTLDGKSIVAMLLDFACKPTILKYAFSCIWLGPASENIMRRLVGRRSVEHFYRTLFFYPDFETWTEWIEKGNWEISYKSYRLLAECYAAKTNELLSQENVQSYFKFIRTLVESKESSKVDFVAFFIDSHTHEVLTEQQRQEFLSILSPNTGIWSLKLFERLVKCDFFGHEVSVEDLEKCASQLLGGNSGLEGKDALDSKAPVLLRWFAKLSEVGQDEKVSAEALWVLCEHYIQGDEWTCYCLSRLLNTFSQGSDEVFLFFAQKALASIEDVGQLSDDFSIVNDIAEGLASPVLLRLLKAGLLKKQLLTDDNIAACISNIISLTLDDFRWLIDGNPHVGNECLKAAAATGRKDILFYLMEVLGIPIIRRAGRHEELQRQADILVEAAKNGHSDIMGELLLHIPELVRVRDDEGLLPIHRVAENVTSASLEGENRTEKLKKDLSILCGKREGGEVDKSLVNAVCPKGTPLVLASQAGKKDVCICLVELGADVNAGAFSEYGAPIVQGQAIDSDICSLILKKKGNLNVYDWWGRTIFNHFPFKPENVAFWNQLIRKASPEIVGKPDIYGKSALHSLVENAKYFQSAEDKKKFEDILKKLVKKFHVDVNMVCSGVILELRGRTPFMEAAENFDISTMKMLLKYGADPCGGDDLGDDAIFSVVTSPLNNRDDCHDAGMDALRFLVEEQKLDVNRPYRDGNTCLCLVTKQKKSRYFDYLVQHGANVHVKNSNGENLLWHALKDRNYELFCRLITDFRVNVSEMAGKGNNKASILDELLAIIDEMDFDTFKKLYLLCLGRKARLNLIENFVYAANMICKKDANLLPDFFNLLHQGGFKEDTLFANTGNTYLHNFSRSPLETAGTVVDYLIRKGGLQVSAKNRGGAWPIHMAAYNANLGVCRVLHQRNANGINLADNDGLRPLDFLLRAKSSPKLEVIKQFIDDLGADPTIVNEEGCTILDQYLSLSDASVEGVVYFCKKGVRCSDFLSFADKEVALFKAYVTYALHGEMAGVIEKLQKTAIDSKQNMVLSIIRCGNIPLLQYLIASGLKLWEYFSGVEFLCRLGFNGNTVKWLRLFFVDWQWPAEYLTRIENSKSFFDVFCENYSPELFSALKFLFEEVKLPGLNAHEVLENVTSGMKKDPCPQNKLDEKTMAYLEKKGAHPEACPVAIVILLSQFRNQEAFVESIDRLVEDVNHENIRLNSDATTTLLGYAARNKHSLFALRYLVEKHGYADSVDLVEALEEAARHDNEMAVNYLLTQYKMREGSSRRVADKALYEAVGALKRLGKEGTLTQLIRLLVEVYHADPDFSEDGEECASNWAKEDLRKYFLRNGNDAFSRMLNAIFFSSP